MAKMIFAFIVFFAVFMSAFMAFKKVDLSQKVEILKIVGRSIICSMVTVLFLVALVALF